MFACSERRIVECFYAFVQMIKKSAKKSLGFGPSCSLVWDGGWDGAYAVDFLFKKAATVSSYFQIFAALQFFAAFIEENVSGVDAT